jgi:hypothetical protein
MARLWLVTLAILGAVSLEVGLAGCSTQPSMTRQERQAQQERESIERPAQPLSEESSIVDKVGQVGVVILIVGITLAGILLPILLLS